jgi:hypothetical protein
VYPLRRPSQHQVTPMEQPPGQRVEAAARVAGGAAAWMSPPGIAAAPVRAAAPPGQGVTAASRYPRLVTVCTSAA